MWAPCGEHNRPGRAGGHQLDTCTFFLGDVMVRAGMSLAELGELPAVIDLVTAGRALGLGRTKSYELARSGDFPCLILRVGNTYRVPTPELLTLLGYPGGGRRPEPEGE
jgi:hypothetical protein